MNSRVLVLGADGFIGRHLIEALAATEWAQPVAAGRRPSPPALSSGAPRIQLDAANADALDSALDGIDAVVSCIAGDSTTIETTARALFASAARRTRPLRIIYLSSMAVYGTATGVVTEDAALTAADPYGRAKVMAEAAGSSTDQLIILRPGIVYGPRSRQWTERIAAWLTAHRIGDLGAAGDGYCNLVYIGDLVAAILSALRLPADAPSVFNLAMGTPPTWNEYFIGFARALGAVPVSRITRRRMSIETKLLAPPLKIAQLLLGKVGVSASRMPEPIPPSLRRLWSQRIRLDSRRAEQCLIPHWTPLAEGLEKSARWLRDRRQH